MKKKRHYHPKTTTGWSKDLPASLRRRRMLKAHKGDYLASARACGALARVNSDKKTQELAGADSRYFYKEYKNRKK